MKPNLLLAVSCIVILAAHYATAVPTQDTYIVAESQEATETSDVFTEEPNAPIKLTEMVVKSEVSLRYAHTAVVTRVRNPARRAQQTTFQVLLPETAFISGFIMTLSGKSYRAYVKEKEEAKKIYGAAVSGGFSAAHISAKARDSNHFTVSVNVEPRTEAVFNLTYEELLVRRNGLYNLAINLHPGALVPKLEVFVHIKESQKISVLRVPEIRTGNEIDATENDAQNSKVTILKSQAANEATISFTPDLEEQTQLIQIYKEKTRESASSNYYSSQKADESANGNLGQFVVQYDIDRPEKGEILVNDGYFVHFFAPRLLTPLRKYVVFVLDTSGSMMGRKIQQLKDAMHAILGDLHSNDYFSIVEFNTYVKVHKLTEASREPHYDDTWHYSKMRSELVPPSLASSENIAKAQIIVSRLISSGGTDIHSALEIAVDIVNKKYETLKTETVFDANGTETYKIDLQPIIIFLTDGDANEGETDTARIVSSITEKNSVTKAVIYSLAFGHDADRDLLRKLSLRNAGFMRQIYEAADAALQLRHFYNQISSPLLSNVNFYYPPEQIKEDTLTQRKFNTIFLGSEVVVAGKLVSGATELAPKVQAYCANDDNRTLKRYEVNDMVIVTEKSDFLPLERLWAYIAIKQLLDERDTTEHTDNTNENNPEKRALAIALKYSFVTPLTSLVVVKPNAIDAVDAVSVDKTPYALPDSTNYAAKWLPSSTLSSYNRYNRRYLALPSLLSASFPHPNAHQSIYSQRFDFDAAMGYDEDDFYPYRHVLKSSNRPLLQSYIPTTSATLPSTTESLEEIYHIKGYSWTLNLLNRHTNSIEFLAKGKNVTLELSKSIVPPKDITDRECAQSVSAVNGIHEAGVCVYLTRCAAARSIALDLYRDTYCVVDNKYAGVCCPRIEQIIS